MQTPYQKIYELARLVVERLEKVSADSIWARRSSGVRGNLLRLLDEFEKNPPPSEHQVKRLENLCQAGFTMLENAAREKRAPKK